MATFGWNPSYSSALDRSPKVRAIAFGDGYEQRTPDGINANPARWSVTFTNRTTAEAASIESFLNDQGGFQSFLWAPPGALTTVTAHGFGVGDGSRTTFQLQRTNLTTENNGDWQGTIPVYTTPRTNLAVRSQEFGTSWNLSFATIGSNLSLGADGTITADKIQEDNTSNQHFAYQSVTTTAQVYTVSVWAQQAERSSLQVFESSLTNASALFNLATGTVTSTSGGGSPSATITAHPTIPGLWKCTLTWTAAAGSSTVRLQLYNGGTTYLGTTGFGLYVWGFQWEVGSVATPYIPTAASAVTVAPAYWPAYGDGFEPVYTLQTTPSIYVAGVLKTAGTDYTISATGLVTFTAAPAANAALTWTGTGTGYKTVVCKKWARQLNAYNSETVTAEFQEVFG